MTGPSAMERHGPKASPAGTGGLPLAEIKRTEGSHSAKGNPPAGDAENMPKSPPLRCLSKARASVPSISSVPVARITGLYGYRCRISGR